MPQSKGKGYRLSAPVLNDRQGLLKFTTPELAQATGIPIKTIQRLKAGRARFKDIGKAQRQVLRDLLQLETEHPDLDCNELHPPRLTREEEDHDMAAMLMEMHAVARKYYRKALVHTCD